MTQFTAQLDIEYYTADAQDQHRFRQAASWIAARFEHALLRVSISIVGDEAIREVNREAMGHDWTTDVVSFLIEETDDVTDGEVIASADTAARLAPQAGWTAQDELLLYVIHGMLHVAGLDDIEPAERSEMRAAERECLLALGIKHANELAQRWDEIST